MAGSRSAGGPRKPLTNLSTPKAEKSKVSSWRRIFNHRPMSDELIVNRLGRSRNVGLRSGRIFDQSDEESEESEESRGLKERKATLPDIRLLPSQKFSTTLLTVSSNVYFG